MPGYPRCTFISNNPRHARPNKRGRNVKQLLLAGVTLLAVGLSAPAAYAAPIIFDYTGSLVTFTVPTTGIYQVLAFGAQGGSFHVVGY